MTADFSATALTEILKVGEQVKPPPESGQGTLGNEKAPQIQDECPPVESGTTSTMVKKLVEQMTQRRTVPLGVSNPLLSARTWWTNRVLIEGRRGEVFSQRFPTCPVYGLCPQGYNYLGRNGQRVRGCNILDGDMMWAGFTDSTIPRRKLVPNPMFKDALSAGADALTAFSTISRMRGDLFAGSVPLALAERFFAEPLDKGNSLLVPFIRALGYMLAFSLPADSGGIDTASIPANSDIVYGVDYQPSSPEATPVQGSGAVNCWFITLSTYQKWMEGRATVGGKARSEIGRSILVLPVDVTRVRDGWPLVWLVICHMFYPLCRVYREGILRDPGGDLEAPDPANAGQYVPFEVNWIPGSMWVTIPGITMPGPGNDISLVLVLTGSYLSQVAGLSARVGNVDVPATADPTAANPVDVGPAIAAAWARPIEATLSDLVTVQGQLFTWGASADVRDAVLFWQGASSFRRWNGEFRDMGHRATFWCPNRTADRGWVDAQEQLPFIARNRQLAMCVPTNGFSQWPGIDVNADDATYQVSWGRIQWLFPYTDMELTLATACSIVLIPSAEPAGSGPIMATDLVPWVMWGGYACMVAIDCIYISSGAPRQLVWYDEANPEYASTRLEVAMLRDSQRVFWGRPGQPIYPGVVSMSCTVSQQWFEDRIRLWYPSNGVILDTTQRAQPLPQAWGGGDMIPGRVDLPSLLTWAEGLTTLQNEPVRDLTMLTWARKIRAANRDARDFITDIPDVIGSDAKVWDVVRSLSGVGANGMDGRIWQTFRRVTKDNPCIEWGLSLDAYTPLTWSSLLSVEEWNDIEEDVAFRISPWSLSVGRPLNNWSLSRNVNYQLVTVDPTVALVKDRYFEGQVRFGALVATSQWDGLVSPLEGMAIARRGVKL